MWARESTLSLPQLLWLRTVPQQAGLLNKGEKKLFSLFDLRYLFEKRCFDSFLFWGRPSGTNSFYYLCFLVKHHCTALVFIMGASRGLGRRAAPLLSLLLPQLCADGFCRVYKTSANKPIFSVSPSSSSEIYCPIFFKARTVPSGGLEGVGEWQKRTP